MNIVHVGLELAKKIVEGDGSLEERRIETKKFLQTFNFSPEELADLKKYCAHRGLLASGSIAVIFKIGDL